MLSIIILLFIVKYNVGDRPEKLYLRSYLRNCLLSFSTINNKNNSANNLNILSCSMNFCFLTAFYYTCTTNNQPYESFRVVGYPRLKTGSKSWSSSNILFSLTFKTCRTGAQPLTYFRISCQTSKSWINVLIKLKYYNFALYLR